jgi:hypothetical protein
MSYEGNVADLDLVGRLVDLSREHFTGAMRFENDGIIKIIYFKDGDILSASTNDRTDSIDEMLLRSGKITREHLKQALANRKESETLGDALLNLGFITRKELTWARRVQVLGIIRSILGWSAGNYTVVSDYLPKREEGTIFPLPQIVIELIVTEPDRARFERLLDSGNATFARDADFDSRFRQFGLNQDAEEIAAQIDGAKSAAEVVAITGKDAFNVYKLLHALELLGMLRRVDRSPRPAPAPPSSAGSGEASALLPFDAAAVVDPVPPADSWTSERWSDAPTSLPDAFEASENAPAASAVASTHSPLELSGLEPETGLPEAELVHDPYDADLLRSQVEENLGGDSPEEGQPGRRGWMGALAAIVLLAILGVAGYLYWLKRESGREPSAAVTPVSRRPGARVNTPGSQPPATASVAESTGTTASHGESAAPAIGDGRVVPTSTGGSLPSGASSSSLASPVPTSPSRPASNSPVVSDTAGVGRRDKPSRSHRGGAVAGAAHGSPAITPNVAKAPNETQLEPATATSPARITNIGRGGSGTSPLSSSAATTSPKRPAKGPPAGPAGNDPLRERYDALAGRHARTIPAGEPYTVQIELVCRTESITRALRAGGDDVWFVPTSFRGQGCYRVFWRHFHSAAAAKQGIAAVPAALGAGSTATVTRVP